MKPLFFILLTSTLATGASLSEVRPLLEKYCAGCHSGTKAAAGVNLRGDVKLPVWHKALQMVEAGQMPPTGAPKPSNAEREKIQAGLEALLESPEQRNPGRPVLRRLTRLEYNNTIRDLLGLDTDLFMFPERLPYTKDYFAPWLSIMPRQIDVGTIEYGNKIPVLLRYSSLLADNRAEYGFTNRGDALNLSPLLMEKYLAVAAEIVDTPDLAMRSPAVRLLLATPGNRVPRDVARTRLAAFLTRAFRRPVSDKETEAYLAPFDAATRRGEPFERAMKESVRAILCSPSLIYISEAPGTRALTSWELASRLSYFLWASMPDDELFALAAEDALTDAAMVESQARRMLKNRKVRELSETFYFQWLQLNELASAQPDLEKFPKYYGNDAFGTNKFNLGSDMLTEALLLFETVLVEDRGVLDFLDARYAWLNHKLIQHYGLAQAFPKQMLEAKRFGPAANNRWHKLPLPDRTRGGVLTMGAPLVLTSTPLRTSPVFRGAWMLETVFNRPPPPPPNVTVPPLDGSKASEAGLSVRQQVEEHRRNPACASCHDRMDPLGFALENFDAVGAWRTQDGKHAVDPSGALSHGRAFTTVEQFKDALLVRREEFVRGFVEHLLSYALGRKLEYYDAPVVKQIVRNSAAADFRFSRIISEIVKSEPFLYIQDQEPPK
jgi:hypothetical protein